ncbi:hypothetical protein [Treponema sp.]|nr:hypothetical protein [Treponema sp.]
MKIISRKKTAGLPSEFPAQCRGNSKKTAAGRPFIKSPGYT